MERAMALAKEVFPGLAISIDMELWEHNIGGKVAIYYKLYVMTTPDSLIESFPTLPALLSFLKRQNKKEE